jgi:hypothetical protein
MRWAAKFNEGRIAAVPIDDHQLLDAVFGHADADVVNQVGQGVVVDADGALEGLMVVGDPVGDQRQHQGLGVAAAVGDALGQVLGIEGIRVQGQMGAMLFDGAYRQQGRVHDVEPLHGIRPAEFSPESRSPVAHRRHRFPGGGWSRFESIGPVQVRVGKRIHRLPSRSMRRTAPAAYSIKMR